MTYPIITVITPSYNQGQYVEQTILSVINQNYQNLEYIIIDGGSTDNTIDTIKKYEHRLSYWISEPDNGQAHAINKGLEKSSGDLVNWINSDDYLETGALYSLAKAWQKNRDSDIFCGHIRCFLDSTNKKTYLYRMGIKKSPTKTLLDFEMNQPGTFYKTSVIKQLGGVNETLRYVFDNELFMRYLCAFGQENIIFITSLIADFRQHGNSKSYGEGYEGFYYENNFQFCEIF